MESLYIYRIESMLQFTSPMISNNFAISRQAELRLASPLDQKKAIASRDEHIRVVEANKEQKRSYKEGESNPRPKLCESPVITN